MASSKLEKILNMASHNLFASWKHMAYNCEKDFFKEFEKNPPHTVA